MAVGKDVRRVEQFTMTQPADGARLLIGVQDTLPEVELVEPMESEPGYVSSASLVDHKGAQIRAERRGVVDCHGERQGGGVVADHERWPLGTVLARQDAMQIDEGDLFLHGAP